MSVGSKFLSRILNEAKKDPVEIEQEMDFDMGHMTSQTKSLISSLRLTKLPEKKIAAFLLMCGVRPKDVKADDTAADNIRAAGQKIQRSSVLKMAFDDLFTNLADVKGIAQTDKTNDFKLSEAINLRGDTWQKMLERVLIELGMPEQLASATAMTSPSTAKALKQTSDEIEQSDELQEKLRTLARKLGVASAQLKMSKEPIEEAVDGTPRLSGVPNKEFTKYVLQLLELLGINEEEMKNTVFKKIIANTIRKDYEGLTVAQMVPTLRTCVNNLAAAKQKATRPSAGQPRQQM